MARTAAISIFGLDRLSRRAGELSQAAARQLLPVLGVAGRAGLGSLELPLAMVAAALVGPLLLSIIGLSAGQWRLLGSGAGRGAGRLAVASGRGSAALGGLLMRSWQRAHRMRGA